MNIFCAPTGIVEIIPWIIEKIATPRTTLLSVININSKIQAIELRNEHNVQTSI